MKHVPHTKTLSVIVFLLASSMLLINSCKKAEPPCKRTVPLTGVFQTQSFITQAGTSQQITVTATGDGTPIGKSSYVGHGQLDANNSFTETGGIITDASGDQIFEMGLKAATPVINPATGDVSLIYTDVITGGTGKYAGATGSYTNVLHGNLFSSVGVDSIKGTITLDGCHTGK